MFFCQTLHPSDYFLSLVHICKTKSTKTPNDFISFSNLLMLIINVNHNYNIITHF